jgi:hypothetical protein
LIILDLILTSIISEEITQAEILILFEHSLAAKLYVLNLKRNYKKMCVWEREREREREGGGE